MDIVQEELLCIADCVASFSRNTDALEKELQECDELIQEANLGS